MSMTGMSSLIGYTRRQVVHFSAAPPLTSTTGVLQFGHATISSRSGSTAISGIYVTRRKFCGTIPCMKVVVLVAVLGVTTSMAEAGQARRAAPPAPQTLDRTAQAYEQYLRAHLLEDDDTDAAITAYKRAMELDPQSPDIPSDLAELYLRENK